MRNKAIRDLIWNMYILRKRNGRSKDFRIYKCMLFMKWFEWNSDNVDNIDIDVLGYDMEIWFQVS